MENPKSNCRHLRIRVIRRSAARSSNAMVIPKAQLRPTSMPQSRTQSRLVATSHSHVYCSSANVILKLVPRSFRPFVSTGRRPLLLRFSPSIGHSLVLTESSKTSSGGFNSRQSY